MKLIKHDTFFNDPWTDLDRFFENTLSDLYRWNSLRFDNATRSMPMDVYETDDERVIRLELPGFHKKEIALELENAVLTVKANRKDKNGDEKSAVRLNRSISLGDDVDTSKVKAELTNGILEVHLPKREQAKPRQIKIN